LWVIYTRWKTRGGGGGGDDVSINIGCLEGSSSLDWCGVRENHDEFVIFGAAMEVCICVWVGERVMLNKLRVFGTVMELQICV